MQKKRYRLMASLVRDNGKFFMGALVCTVITVLIGFITPMLLAEVIDHYLGDQPSRMPGFINAWIAQLGGRGWLRQNLWLAGLTLVIIQVINGVFSYLKGRWNAVGAENAAQTLRNRLYDHIQILPYAYHVKAQTGDLIQRSTSDVETVRRFLAVQLLAVVNALMLLGVALSLMLPISLKITLVSTVIMPPLFLYSMLFFKRVIKAFREVDECEGRLSTALQENLAGVRVVRAFGQAQREIEKFDALNDAFRDKSIKMSILDSVYWSTSDYAGMLQVALTLIICVYEAVAGRITAGELVIFASYIQMLLWPVRQLGRILSEAGKSMVALERIEEILNVPPEAPQQEALCPSLRGDIEFDHVSFAYENGHEVLHDTTFTIRQGQTAAILGATGSGKSTIVHLLQRLYEPTGGEIRIGGVPLQKMDRHHLRAHVGLILQEPFLYSKTIRENVAVAAPASGPEQVDGAVQDAAAWQFIQDSEKGYDTLVGERGVTLSGGQKQRLAIARTLLKDNDILIFDDSLSAVDTHTDAAIRAALRKRRRNVTTIIIGHRITTLREADLVLVLEDGRISAQGTHRQLIAQPGLYARIYGIQAGLDQMLAQEQAPGLPKEVNA